MPDCDKYGFFNGIYGLEQVNWANYWRGIVGDGVVAGQGNEMSISTTGRSNAYGVVVNTGEAMVDNHKAWISTAKEVVLGAPSSQPRYDLVVLKLTYGNSGASKIEVTSVAGTAAASPSVPTVTSVTGGTYYLVLASVYRAAGEDSVSASNITDRRHIFGVPSGYIKYFTGTSVTPTNDIEYRNQTAISSLTVNLPGTPDETYHTCVCFTSGSSFSGVTFKKGGSAYTAIGKKGDSLTLPSKRYNLMIWWDGIKYFCVVIAA